MAHVVGRRGNFAALAARNAGRGWSPAELLLDSGGISVALLAK